MHDHFRSPTGAPTSKSRSTATLKPLGAGDALTLVVDQPMKLGRSSHDPRISAILTPFEDVSSEHVSLTLNEDGSVKIVDLEPLNGTWVRGERMPAKSSRTVRLPVQIRLGRNCTLKLVEGPVQPPETR